MQSLSDKIRDMTRTTLQNLLLIILEEISLVKSDMPYQVHFRLSREIKQILGIWHPNNCLFLGYFANQTG